MQALNRILANIPWNLLLLLSGSNLLSSQLQYKKQQFSPHEIWTQLHRGPSPPHIDPDLTTVIKEKWIDQPLDHFDEQNKKTWKMRYLANEQLYWNGGPIFIYVGGEWEIDSRWVEGGHFYDIAKETGAYLIYTEHRYYGKSRPVEDTSLENLKYLTTDQALADLAYLIKHLKEQTRAFKRARVILTGGSYAGTLVTWFRQRYPELCDGAWASSAPLLAKIDFKEYKEVVGFAYEQEGGEACYQIIQDAFTDMEKLIEANDVQRIEEDLVLCNKLDATNELDVANMFLGLSNLLGAQVQQAKVDSVKNTCNFLLDPQHIDGIAALAAYVRLVYGDSCYRHEFSYVIESARNTSWENPTSSPYRTFRYQMCSELGWYQSSSSENQPFGQSFSLAFWVELCRQLFGDKFTLDAMEASIRRINLIHKGNDTDVSKVYFTHGDLDPWKPVGVLRLTNQRSPVDIISRASHMNDLQSVSVEDPPELLVVKFKVRNRILEWALGPKIKLY